MSENDKKAPGLSKDAIERMKREMLYTVGYGKPPEATRFKKGQSGNPAGRPRTNKEPNMGMLPIEEAMLRHARSKVKVRVGENVTEVPMSEAVVQAAMTSALKGNVRAQGLVLKRIEAVELKAAEEIQRRKEWAQHFKDVQSKVLAEALAKGEPAPQILPHPDDIVIDEKEGYRIIGPIDQTEQARLEETLQMRDILIVQEALDQRGRPGGRDGPYGTAMLSAIALNNSVPARYRRSDAEIDLRFWKAQAKPRRTLEKELYRSWKALGVSAKRGATFPDAEYFKRRVEFLAAVKKAVEDGNLDINALAKGQMDESAHSFLREWDDRLRS